MDQWRDERSEVCSVGSVPVRARACLGEEKSVLDGMFHLKIEKGHGRCISCGVLVGFSVCPTTKDRCRMDLSFRSSGGRVGMAVLRRLLHAVSLRLPFVIWKRPVGYRLMGSEGLGAPHGTG